MNFKVVVSPVRKACFQYFVPSLLLLLTFFWLCEKFDTGGGISVPQLCFLTLSRVFSAPAGLVPSRFSLRKCEALIFVFFQRTATAPRVTRCPPRPSACLFLSTSATQNEEEEASTEAHRILGRIVGKGPFLALRRSNVAFATNRLARSLAKPSKSDIIASERLWRTQCGTVDFGLKRQVRKQSMHNADSLHRYRLGWRSTHAQARAFVPRVKRSASKLGSLLVFNA